MDYSKRISEWKDKFYKFLRAHHPDLEEYFSDNLIFSPAVDNPNILDAGYNPLEDKAELKEKRESMFEAFENFYRENPV